MVINKFDFQCQIGVSREELYVIDINVEKLSKFYEPGSHKDDSLEEGVVTIT